jgi:hypothetical protein
MYNIDSDDSFTTITTDIHNAVNSSRLLDEEEDSKHQHATPNNYSNTVLSESQSSSRIRNSYLTDESNEY